MTFPDISPAAASALLLSQLDPEHDLKDALRRLENEVRREPASVRHRWALAEMLCLLRDGARALKQVQICARLAGKQDASSHSRAQMLRGLIRAETQRQEVFAGRVKPLAVIDSPPWMDELAQAIALNATGDHAGADQVRRAALEAAPTRPVLCRCAEELRTETSKADAAPGPVERRFEWIGDSDTRLGPVCEFIVAGGYRWVAFADIATMQVTPPSSLLDLVWLPVAMQLRGTQAGAQTLHGFVPTRHSGGEASLRVADARERDALILARLTRWQEYGETGVFAIGQKTLMTDAGDVPLLTLRALRADDDSQAVGVAS